MNVGDRVPDLLGLNQEGEQVYSRDYLGTSWILYFYPKDNTAGCTAEACSLRDHIEELAAQGFKVVGVSKDSAASHRKFIDRYQLPFPLIADTEHTLQEAMGVWVAKKLYGREYMGTERTTFIIDAEGIIRHILRGKEIKTKEHAAQLLQAKY